MTTNVLCRVFRHGRYTVVALGVAFTVVSVTLLVSNLSIIIQVFSSAYLSSSTKLSFLFSLYGALSSNFSAWSALLLIVTALLFGVNIALLTFYIRRRQEKSGGKRAHLATIGGVVSAVLGIGCAACGSIVLTAVLGLFGAGGLLLLLPFHGVEFGILGLVLLSLSIRYLMKHIDDPLVCPIKTH